MLVHHVTKSFIIIHYGNFSWVLCLKWNAIKLLFNGIAFFFSFWELAYILSYYTLGCSFYDSIFVIELLLLCNSVRFIPWGVHFVIQSWLLKCFLYAIVCVVEYRCLFLTPMYLISFVLQQTLHYRLKKEKEVHGVSVHLLMIDRLASSCFFLTQKFIEVISIISSLQPVLIQQLLWMMLRCWLWSR